AAQSEGTERSVGVLSLVVRRGGLVQRLLGWVASWNPWMWDSAIRPNSVPPYLLGLLILGLTLAILRAVTSNIMNYAAASATLDAATRMRRAVYHHSTRLGTLALRPDGANEPVMIFTRHVENVHDALYARLTTYACEPLQLALLSVFALLIDPLLALSFL